MDHITGMKPSKHYIREYIREHLESHTKKNVRLLDLGCGRAEIFYPLVKNFSNLSYVGVEPNRNDLEKAKNLYKEIPNANFINRFVTSNKADVVEPKRFNFVVSLSVLEHVKNLDHFLELSVRASAPGGDIIHLYDLGHSLYPNSLKERIQVALCNNAITRKIVPKNKIATYVSLNEVKEILERCGAKEKKTTFHNMRSNVQVIKRLGNKMTEEMIEEITQCEIRLSRFLPDNKEKERIFPSVAVWYTLSNSKL